MRRSLWLGVMCAALLAGAPAHAQHSEYFGNEAAMTAGSGMALYRGADAAYYNPAGLAGLQRTKIEISGTAFVLRIRNFPGLLTVDLPSGRYQPSIRSLEVLPIPAALVFTRGVHPKVTLSLGIFVTSSDRLDGSSTFNRMEQVSGEDLQFLQRAVFKHVHQTYHIGPGVGWQVTPRFRLGASLLLLYRTAHRHLSLVVDARNEAEGADQVQTSSTFDYETETALFGGRLVAGLQWEMARGWHLGAVVRSPTLSFHQTGETAQLVTAAQLRPGVDPFTSLTLDTSEPADASGQMAEPAEFVLGLGYRHRRFWIGAEAELRLGMTNRDLLIDDHLQWNTRLGARVWLKETLSLGFGGFTDRSPRDSIPFVGDYRVDYYGFTLGVQWESRHAVKGRPRADGLIFSTTIALRYAYGAGDARGYAYRYPPESSSDQQYPTVPVRFHDLGLHIGSSLYF